GADADYEFLELYNNEAEEVNLLGYYFSAGIDYTFTETDIIPANGYFLLAIKSEFYENSVQWTSGGLVNGGETITLVNSDDILVDEVTYGDGGDWPSSPDGGGSSLELISPELDNSLATNWQGSFVDNGTPGAVNSSEGLDAPTNVQISHNATNVTISWNSVDGATTYKIESSETPDGTYTEVTDGILNGTSWTKAEASSKKFYRVVAQ
ncbi:MAG: lamin tail domain-containing protein, partial [Candidatus Cloacimonadota bacterium]|nr:lamin tail domain-containing protein [Candidatus Cloacimonadota bacterium]